MDSTILERMRSRIEEHESLANAMPLEEIVVADSSLFQKGVWEPYFRRLRREDPVHYEPVSRFGAHWSVTKYEDIKAVDSNWRAFSSDIDRGGIHIGDKDKEYRLRSLITSDPPKHTSQRRAIQPIVSSPNLAQLETLIRHRTGVVLDGLPNEEEFDWVRKVSIELTSLTLATIFGFPIEDRQKLMYWSDIAFMDVDAGGPVASEEMRAKELVPCLEAFTELLEKKRSTALENNIISLIAHSEAYQDISPSEFLGNLSTLIVGGNDTTRNSMSGSVLAMDMNPDQAKKLRCDPSLLDSLVSESIRYQTPILAFRRTATQDTELSGKTIREGDRVVMWYVSGNRDEDVFFHADRFLLGRDNARNHIAFGFGVHRCLGNRLAELQLRVLWEEILARGIQVEVVGEPIRGFSTFVNAIESLPVIVKKGMANLC